MIFFESNKSSLNLPDAPRFAQRTGIRCYFANHIAEHRGRQDASQQPDTNGLYAYTHALLRKADHVCAAIDDAYLEASLALAQEIARHQSSITPPSNPSVSPHDAIPAPATQSSLITDQARRKAAAESAARRSQEQSRAAAARTVAELHERQHHLELAARDLARSWSARCDELIARHRRGILQREPSITDIPLPRHHANYSWANDPATNNQEMHQP